MADLALVTAGRLNVVSGVGNGHEQETFEAAEQINVGQVFRIDTSTGKATKGNATAVGESGIAAGAAVAREVPTFQLYLCIDQARQAGNPVTGLRKGKVDGFELSALSYGQRVYLSDTDGALGDAAGTVPLAVGRVMPRPLTGTPTVQDKVLSVDFPNLRT